ncbi:MAG: hypothetical protein RL208_156 [Pseudomonadota bacterium]|jgi:hypothetical protein
MNVKITDQNTLKTYLNDQEYHPVYYGNQGNKSNNQVELVLLTLYMI